MEHLAQPQQLKIGNSISKNRQRAINTKNTQACASKHSPFHKLQPKVNALIVCFHNVTELHHTQPDHHKPCCVCLSDHSPKMLLVITSLKDDSNQAIFVRLNITSDYRLTAAQNWNSITEASIMKERNSLWHTIYYQEKVQIFLQGLLKVQGST